MREKIVSTKNFVAKHRVAIAVTTTALTCLWLNRAAVAGYNEFLQEHNLLDEYYHEGS